jgi:hypothetical protein
MTRKLRFAFWSLSDFREGLKQDLEIATKSLNVSFQLTGLFEKRVLKSKSNISNTTQPRKFRLYLNSNMSGKKPRAMGALF